MATSAPSDADGVKGDVLEQVMVVTAVDRERAEALLASASGNVERAINLFFETLNSSQPAEAENVGNCSAVVPIEEPVRAPILPRADILAESGHSEANYTRAERRSRLFRHSRLRTAPHADSVFDKFRDFRAEIRLQEQRLTAAGDSSSSPSSSSPSDSTAHSAAAAVSKRRTLEEMFRPPLELLCLGSFQAARDTAAARRRWLLVNVQNTAEFACQVLNRDVWSDAAVAALVRRHFVLWQVYHESGEGLKYRTFYPVRSWPYVAAVDPRTGELMSAWHWQCHGDQVLRQLEHFLADNPYEASDAGSEQPAAKCARTGVVDLDEESQMRLAIERSMCPATVTQADADDIDAGDDEDGCESPPPASCQAGASTSTELPERDARAPSPSAEARRGAEAGDTASTSDTPTNSVSHCPTSVDHSPPGGSTAAFAADHWKLYLGSACDPQWTLALRLPDGRRLELQLPSSSQLRSVQLYVEQQLGCAPGTHELIAQFPRRQLSRPQLLQQTLLQIGLHSHDTLFVQQV